MKLKLAICLYLLISLLTGGAAQADDFERELGKARDVFLQGVDGDRYAVRDATRRFRYLNHRNPQEPVLMAYLGACMTLQGRDAANNLDKRRLTDVGLSRIDRALELQAEGAVSASAHYLDTMLVAANAFIHIPAFFNRHDRGKQLLQQILADEAFADMPNGFRAATYLAAALVARGEGDTTAYRRYLELTVTTDPDGRNGRYAGSLRDEL